MDFRLLHFCFKLSVIGSLFWGCQPCEYVYDYPPNYCRPHLEEIKQEPIKPSKSLPPKSLHFVPRKKKKPIPEEERPAQEPQPPAAPAVKETVPEPLPIPSGKMSRRTLKPKPYGLVVPFTEQCSKKDLEEEESQESAIDWSKISPWIYKDNTGTSS